MKDNFITRLSIDEIDIIITARLKPILFTTGFNNSISSRRHKSVSKNVSNKKRKRGH